MATLFENWCTADGGTELSGVVTLTPIAQQAAGPLTLATVPEPITVTGGAFTAEVTPGEYLVDVELRAGDDEVRISTDKATQRIAVADLETSQRLRDLIGLGAPGQSPLAKLNAIVTEWIEGVADAAYVRSVNGVPVDPETGNVEVNPGNVDSDRLLDADDDPEVHFGLKDPEGRTSFAALSDGTIDIPLPTLAGGKLREQDSHRDYMSGTKDAAGRTAEDVYYNDGTKPQWVLDRWKERMGLGAGGSSRPRIHVIVCGGQSNAAVSAGVSPPAGLFETNPRLWKWNRATGAIVALPTSEGYLLPSFAREYIKTVPDDVQVLVVPCGWGETGFTTTSLASQPGYTTVTNGTWDRTLTADPKNLYAMMVADLAAARVAAAPLSSEAPKVVALLWSQGEADIAMTESAYAAKLDDLIAQFRTDTTLSTLPVLIGSMTPEYVAQTSGAMPVQTALTDTPRRVQRTAFIHGPKGLTRSDQSNHIHYSMPGQNRRGRLFCEALPRAIWNYSGIYADPPQNLRAVRSGTTLTAEWDPSPLRATAHTAEVSSDGGSTWSPLSLVGGAIGLSGTATVPATGALTVRVSATNETNTSAYATVTL
ncbi:tail protein [Gordonia phage Hedwig]|uniref:Minor tail protein n=1 Tax=Gordonia phage Hedwig TaxID=1887648 RepID=A0A1C9EHQ6_9CAUD|nr:tail protein [Gordonia phage Hedwig]AON97324.1 minor tail protein [Gordonia phage Hedwig]